MSEEPEVISIYLDAHGLGIIYYHEMDSSSPMNMGKGYEDKPMSEIIETLKGVSCATLWGILGDAYTMEHMNPLYGDCKVVGPAATMKYGEITADMTPEDVDREIPRIGNPIHRLFDSMNPGDIVIGAALGHERSGVYGDCYATAFKAKGAVAIVTETRRASISGVQRRLKIGYNRAARMIESMEETGIVGPLQSNGSREVLAPPPPEA